LRRRWLGCQCCGDGGCRADAVVGLCDYVSPRLTRLLARFGVGASFEQAAEMLEEAWGVRVAAETARTRIERVARRAEAWREPAEPQRRRFAPQFGHLELTVDAGKVRTIECGWRDLKLANWCRRQRASPALPSAWRQRQLPKVGPRLINAGIGGHEAFTADWPTQTQRLGGSARTLDFLADGADWIWNDRQRHLPESTGVLDVWHASEKLHEAAAALYGEHTPAAQAWGDAATDELVAGGWPALQKRLDHALEAPPSARASTALFEARTYFYKKRAHLDYASQLQRGGPIGSGMVEGEAKQMNKRLKAAGVAWHERNVRAMSSLCAIMHSKLWRKFTASPT
jgi:hypothetical protein